MSDIRQIMADKGLGKRNSIGDVWDDSWCADAAAEITRLRALVEELKADRIRINDEAETEIKRLREALKPFSQAATAWEAGGYNSDKDQLVESWPEASDDMLALTLGDLRRARKVLEGGE